MSKFIIAYPDSFVFYLAKEEAVSVALGMHLVEGVDEVRIYEIEEAGSVERVHMIAAQKLRKEQQDDDNSIESDE